MEALERVYKEFHRNLFEEEKLLTTDTFDAIFRNEYEIYFIKYLEKLYEVEEVWEYENEIFDYQNQIITNNDNLAYNLNFVIVSNNIDLRARRVLEQDKYTSKKIILHVDNLMEDLELLPFNKKQFNQSNLNEDLDNVLLSKLKRMDNADELINILNKDEIFDKDISNILGLLRGNTI